MVISGLAETLPFAGQRFPLILQPAADSSRDVAATVTAHREELADKLLEHGALLFRGFDVRGVQAFDAFVDAVSKERAAYLYRSTPRSSAGRGIYTATEYPPQLEIPLHNENAYQSTWPLKIAFCCLTPAAAGGETPLADMRRVTASIGAAGLLDGFASRGVRYIRHYQPFVDLPWQVVFQTDDRDAVARYCTENEISYEWLDQDTLRTAQTCQGVARHPITGDTVYFNQAHLFHVSSLGAEDAVEMLEIYGADRLPRHACYGDGQEIGARDLDAVAAAFRSEAVSLPWLAGDVMLIDNMQIAHGRRPFSGERNVVAALLDLHAERRPAFERRA